jgi:hypothetical protein
MYEVCRYAGLRCHDIQYITSFIKIGSAIEKLLEGFTNTDSTEISFAYVRKAG